MSSLWGMRRKESSHPEKTGRALGNQRALQGRDVVLRPNNPTGNYWSWDTLKVFLDEVAGRQIVVDEAYGEFVEVGDYPDGMSRFAYHPNLVVFRTFSKMYGIARLRIGYLAGSMEVVNVIRRTGVVYSVTVWKKILA